MPIKDDQLNSEYSGKIIDQIKLKNEGWSDQGSKNYHYGFTQKKGLWIKRIDPANPCGHYTIWLFLMLYVNKNVINIIKTAVHQVSNDGGFLDLNVPFAPADRDNAKNAIKAILA